MAVGAVAVLAVCVTGFGQAADFNRSSSQRRGRGGVSSVPPMPLVAAAQTLWLLHWFPMPPLVQGVCSSMSWSMGRVPLFGLDLFDKLDKMLRGGGAAPLSQDPATSKLRTLLHEQAFGGICVIALVSALHLLSLVFSVLCSKSTSPPDDGAVNSGRGRSKFQVLADSWTLYALYFGHAGACELCARAFLGSTNILHEPIALSIVVVLASYALCVWPAVFASRLYYLKAETFVLPPTVERHMSEMQAIESWTVDDMIARRVSRADSGCCCFPCHCIRETCFSFKRQQRWELRNQDAMLMPFVGALTYSSRMHALYAALRLGLLSVLVSLPVCGGDMGSLAWSPLNCDGTSFWNAALCGMLAIVHLTWLCICQPYSRGYDLIMDFTDEICMVCILTWWAVSGPLVSNMVLFLLLLFIPIVTHLFVTLATTCMSSARSETQVVRLTMLRSQVDKTLAAPDVELNHVSTKLRIPKVFSGPPSKSQVHPSRDANITDSDTDSDLSSISETASIYSSSDSDDSSSDDEFQLDTYILNKV